ncbi:Large neutral amino acids transporter small subunit 2 [Thelohanellus kitauei]|uniref:Large neutral amino acids transporter small subunit 2 n=1 Tax=Thelohanellus kitauei TaxID=669202 RepID=A0A0C2MLE8_THEKT|nr:Large neutral amino acids transporter small subunit 2 [Thelohanellus kitauei]
MKNPVRDLPLAMFLGIFFVMLFYVMAAVSYSATLGYGVVRVSETVALTLAIRVLNQAYFIIPILICCSTFGATNGNFYASGSVIASAGFSGDLPLVFSMVHKTSRTPIVALFVELALSMIFISFKFQVLLNYAAFISWVIYLVSFCALLKLKLTSKNQPKLKIFRMPIIFIFPMILVCIFTVVMCFYLKPIGCGVFAAIIIVIFGFQFIPDELTSIGIFTNLHHKLVGTLIARCNLVPATSDDVS